MDPTLENNTSQQEKSKKGPVSQGINLLNNIPGGGVKIPFGKIIRPGVTVLKGFTAFLAANPWVWGILGGVVLVIVVFAIVFSGAFGGIPGAPTQEIAPTIAPTETPTPTPPAEL